MRTSLEPVIEAAGYVFCMRIEYFLQS